MSELKPESAHPVYQHRDGSKCIWLDDTGWFVPLDVGGEGYDCRSPEHEAQREFYLRTRLAEEHRAMCEYALIEEQSDIPCTLTGVRYSPGESNA